MMNRDRMTRGRTWTTNGATTLGIPERLERALIYPLLLVIVLFVPSALAWILGILLGVLVFFIEKNRNVRWNALQAVATLGPLSILYAVVNIVKFFLGGLPLIGGVVGFGLGLLGSVIWWVMIILAIYLLVMAWFRPNYHLPLVGNLIERWI
jgi:uncharacterized membrane protein